ncbi:N-acetyl sugar amidotransferase [Alphaproteobacteria bacterium]|nr:N-acetyl sugar amidotransferase [Alphaproteobacteria bacterium]
MIKYCTRCLYPETKPDLWFDDAGVCNACLNYDNRDDVDWVAREQSFLELIARFKITDGSNYDCIIPSSGGKDSHYQVIKMLELGVNPLVVTATTDALSAIGRRNIENVKNLGVDCIEVTPNPVLRRRLAKFGLEQVGDISWTEHVAIFTVPIRIAVQLRVPLIIWGENPQNEYGGPSAATDGYTLTRRWLEEFGGLLGLRISDLIGQIDIERKDIIQYTYPDEETLNQANITGVFLGHFCRWDGYTNALIAQSYGLETYPQSVEGSVVNYENLDNHQTGIHDYFKFLKYGFGRATDLVCNHIRRGRITRAQGLQLVMRHDGKFPATYLGKPIEHILEEIELNLGEFYNICDRFTNKRLFQLDEKGDPQRDRSGNLVKINHDNP